MKILGFFVVFVSYAMLIYATSADEKFYQARIASCSVWVPVGDVAYLPLTMENIAMESIQSLGDAYGWGGMLDVEDCSGMVRTIYSCFGLEVARNGNWQWNMNMEKIDMTNRSVEEKCMILDEMPMDSALLRKTGWQNL